MVLHLIGLDSDMALSTRSQNQSNSELLLTKLSKMLYITEILGALHSTSMAQNLWKNWNG